MSKFISTLLSLAFVVVLTPVTFAASSSSSSAPEVRISSATVETDRQRVTGSVKLCNHENTDVRFILNAKNETINSLYMRRLTLAGGKCQVFNIRFDKDFADMTNTGDEISFVAKSIRGRFDYGKYNLSEEYTTTVKEGNKAVKGCGDAVGEDEIYSVCENDFIYHEPSGLRIKVIKIDNQRVEILVTHVRWGGVKKFYIYKNRSKEIVSGNDEHTRVTLSNLLGENKYEFLFKIESE